MQTVFQKEHLSVSRLSVFFIDSTMASKGIAWQLYKLESYHWIFYRLYPDFEYPHSTAIYYTHAAVTADSKSGSDAQIIMQ